MIAIKLLAFIALFMLTLNLDVITRPVEFGAGMFISGSLFCSIAYDIKIEKHFK